MCLTPDLSQKRERRRAGKVRRPVGSHGRWAAQQRLARGRPLRTARHHAPRRRASQRFSGGPVVAFSCRGGSAPPQPPYLKKQFGAERTRALFRALVSECVSSRIPLRSEELLLAEQFPRSSKIWGAVHSTVGDSQGGFSRFKETARDLLTAETVGRFWNKLLMMESYLQM